MFQGRKLLIATQHEKERVIAPILGRELGVQCIINKGFDTDKLGTFSGEVERTDDPITTARNKCLMAMDLANCDLAISSEGSFGPHPTIYFLPADEEFLVFIDKKNNLEIIAREISTETNFNAAEIKTKEDLSDFIKCAKFPSHGLIIKNKKDKFTDIVKGITNHDQLENTFTDFISKYGQVYIETDMRAMHNPTRMKVIEKAVFKLANMINSFCPNCGSPGFVITEAKAGLPCELCNLPTRSTLCYVYICQKCHYINEVLYPHNKTSEDPLYCDVCNP